MLKSARCLMRLSRACAHTALRPLPLTQLHYTPCFCKVNNNKKKDKVDKEKEEARANTEKTIDLNIVEDKMKEEIEQLKVHSAEIVYLRPPPVGFLED